MRKFTSAAVAGIAALAATAVHGQTYSVGTNPQGSLAFA